MEKIYVKLKDSSGSFFVFSQGISVNRTQICEVEKDEIISTALVSGVLVESTKAEYEKAKKTRDDYFAAQEKADKKIKEDKNKTTDELDEEVGKDANVEFNAEVAKALLSQAVEKNKVKLDKDNYSFGKLVLGNESDAIDLLINDEKVRGDIQKSVA